MKVVIMAGGRGTRIASVSNELPKPMIVIGGKPVLEREIECLKTQGFTDLIITVGYLGHVIIDYFGDGSAFGVSIEYYVEEHLLGNAGALYEIKSQLTDDFFLLNADALFDIDFKRMLAFHKKKKADVTILSHPNNHPEDSGLLIVENDDSVREWLTKEERRSGFFKNQVNAGIHILSPVVLKSRPETEKVDLDTQILKPLCGSGRIFAYQSTEYVKDMGTPERLQQVEKDILNGKVSARNLSVQQRAIFLDRDGTINKYVGFLKDIEEFELLPGVAEAIRHINESSYLCIVVTNQPVIARGDVTIEELQNIHCKMETLLGRDGAYIDGLYYCPHHPDRGFAGERVEFKIDCDCRKPKSGMLMQAAERYNIDLKQSWMIGDSIDDILAGKSAGCKTGFISDVHNEKVDVDEVGENLLQIVKRVL